VPTVPLTTTDHAYLTDNAGEYVVAESTTPNQPLVTTNASLTSNARHVVTRSGSTVVAASSGRDIYARGGIGLLVTDRPSLIVQPITGALVIRHGFSLLLENGSLLLAENNAVLVQEQSIAATYCLLLEDGAHIMAETGFTLAYA